MNVSTSQLIKAAQAGGYAIGAFNVYNLEGIKAVLAAAENEHSPVILQLHPSALRYGGTPLIALTCEAARLSRVPVVVHLDHSTSLADIELALQAGFSSVMVDGSHLEYEQNMSFTRQVAGLAHAREVLVEAELGRLSGTEDGLSVSEYEARLTDPHQAVEFVHETGADLLAVCIGNVHGEYRSQPHLDFPRLEKIYQMVEIPLVLHGASGLPQDMIFRSIELGVRKINVNTEVRTAYVQSLRERLSKPKKTDLIDLMQTAVAAMQAIVTEKIRLFGSSHQASEY
jgi:tagatose 1,6-diphosphate aldolase GatY/KbaY